MKSSSKWDGFFVKCQLCFASVTSFFLSSFVFCGIKLDLYLCNFNLINAPKSVFWSNAQKNLHLYPYREHSSAGIKTSRLSKKITSLQLACGNNVLM
jgi:hypothetical protein